MELKVNTEETYLLKNKAVKTVTFTNIPSKSSRQILEEINAIYQDLVPLCNYDEKNRFYIYFGFAFGNLIFIIILATFSPTMIAKRYNGTEEGAISLMSSIITIYVALAGAAVFLIRFGKKIHFRRIEENKKSLEEKKKTKEQELTNFEEKEEIRLDDSDQEIEHDQVVVIDDE